MTTQSGGCNPRRRAAERWLLALLLVLGVVVLFSNYGAGIFSRWDEGLYGRFARNALRFGDYVLPLDEQGNYAKEPFSKPPLSFLAVALSFELFGASVETLRLPFSLSTLATALVCAQWGNDISRHHRQSVLLGFFWGFFLLLSEAAMRWGRYAVIEDMFVLWLVLALWLHSRSMTRRLHWAALSGICLSLAFLTKQLAFGVAALPMLCVELLHIRQFGFKRAAVRTLLWGVPPVATAIGWVALAYAREGETFRRMLWDFALIQRFQGYAGTIHFNKLNRVAGLLDDVTQPFSWQLGIIGLLGFVGYSLRRRAFLLRAKKVAQPLPHVGIVLFFLVGVLVFENSTKSLLPWYTLAFLPAVAFGLAWLTALGFRAARLYWRRPRARISPFAAVDVTLAVCLLFVALEAGALRLVSRLNVAVLLAIAGALLVAVRRLHWRPVWAPAGLLCAGVLFLLSAHFRHVEYLISPGRLEVAMGAVSRLGLERVVVSRGVSRLAAKNYEPITLFGSSTSSGSPPWVRDGAKQPDGFVDTAMVPRQVQLPAGVQIERVPGGTVWGGDLMRDPLPGREVSRLLGLGPLTFESDDMETGRALSLARDGEASGGLARGYKPWLSESGRKHVLSVGTTPVLPEGDYVVAAHLKWQCAGLRGAKVGFLSADKRRKELPCNASDTAKGYRPVTLKLTLKRARRVKLTVGFHRGRSELWHDKTEIWRADKWSPRRSALAPSSE